MDVSTARSRRRCSTFNWYYGRNRVEGAVNHGDAGESRGFSVSCPIPKERKDGVPEFRTMPAKRGSAKPSPGTLGHNVAQGVEP